MEWLWLLLGILLLGILWLLILGVEKLSERMKQHDESRRLATERVAERTAEAESAFRRKQSRKILAKTFIEEADFSELSESDNAEVLQEAVEALSTTELVQSVARRMFGAPESTDAITANQSAFDPVRRVVAKGEASSPVRVKASKKSPLSKSEQKMLKKIKQGD